MAGRASTTDVEHLSDGFALLGTLEKIPSWRNPRWEDLGRPVLDRGDQTIFPRTVDRRRRMETLALYVLPKDWVWEPAVPPEIKRAVSHARRMAREWAAADATWSWPLE